AGVSLVMVSLSMSVPVSLVAHKLCIAVLYISSGVGRESGPNTGLFFLQGLLLVKGARIIQRLGLAL
ncbi:hypothetical protein J6A32_04760, partial [Methanocorpusculum sp.]|nr:hypothetical protein [Methanocorpusculum sp.]